MNWRVTMGSFGSALRRRRRAAGLSQPELAAEVRWSQSRVSRAESGEALPSEDMAARLDEALAAGGELRLLWGREAAERSARKAARREIGVDEGSVGESERRQLLAVAGAIAFGAPLPEPAREIIKEAFAREEPTRVGHGDVARVEAATRELARQDHSAGGAAVRHRVLGELQWGMTLLGGSCQPGVRQRLQVAVAYLADLAAWSTADAGHIGPARKLFLLGLRAARESGDPGILTHVATGYARVEIQGRDPKAALDLTRLARAGDRSVPRPAVSMVHAVRGLALAWLPDGPGCRRQLGVARDVYVPPQGDDPHWIRFFTPAKVRGDESQGLYDLYLTTGSVAPGLVSGLRASFAAYPDGRARSKAITGARLATLMYRAGDTAGARAVRGQTAALARGVRSVRLDQDLATLDRVAARHRQ